MTKSEEIAQGIKIVEAVLQILSDEVGKLQAQAGIKEPASVDLKEMIRQATYGYQRNEKFQKLLGSQGTVQSAEVKQAAEICEAVKEAIREASYGYRRNEKFEKV